MAVTAVHRIGARCEWFALAPAIRRISGCFAVDHIGCDGQNALRMSRAAIGRMFADLLHEPRDDIAGNTVDAVIVVSQPRGRILALVLVIDDETGVIANQMNFAVLYRRKAVGDDRQSGYAERHGPQKVMIV